MSTHELKSRDYNQDRSVVSCFLEQDVVFSGKVVFSDEAFIILDIFLKK